MLTSLRTLYKIGPGPSSSHTMGPFKAAGDFLTLLPVDFDGTVKVTLFGSLALTGRGHMTDRIIEKAFGKIPTEIVFDINTKPIHPNTLKFEAVVSGDMISETYLSVGGGTVLRQGQTLIEEEEKYDVDSLETLKDRLQSISLRDYVCKCEGADIESYLTEILHAMFMCIENGLTKTGTVAGTLKVKRVAKEIFELAQAAEPKEAVMLTLAAYAYAVAEENSGGFQVATAPTCGSAGVLPAVLYYLYKYKGYDEDKLIEGLMVAGLIGLIVKHNATISGAVGGCQAEIGTATSMAAAALTYLKGQDLGTVEYAAELAMEHSLGLTCDPVGGYVAIPCIERNAVGALRAYEAYVMARFIGKARRNAVTFDEVVAVMAETGRSLPTEYKETSLGGLAKIHKHI